MREKSDATIHAHMTPTHEDLTTWCQSLSKVELHLHLEGAIPIPALWELVQKYGGDPLVPDEAALWEYFKFRDFPHFIELWIWKNGFLRPRTRSRSVCRYRPRPLTQWRWRGMCVMKSWRTSVLMGEARGRL